MRWMPCSRPQISSLHNLIGGGAFIRIKSRYLPVVPKVSRNSFITNSNTSLDIPVRYPRGRLLIVDVIFYTATIGRCVLLVGTQEVIE